MLEDFGEHVRAACTTRTTKTLLEQWNADPNIRLEWSPAPVTVDHRAFSKEASGEESIEGVAHLADLKNREIPFTCVFGQNDFRVTRVIRGEIGLYGMCDWEAGTLLSRSYTAARRQNHRVSLGHTHPKSFGAVCSGIYYDAEDLTKLTDAASPWILQQKLYERWGGDYTEMYARRMLKQKVISRFSWILSPKENQAGVFEILNHGRVRYHPWRVEFT